MLYEVITADDKARTLSGRGDVFKRFKLPDAVGVEIEKVDGFGSYNFV